ncbi:hypothetical protein CBL_00897 [Carabus blaptoides fortunei]
MAPAQSADYTCLLSNNVDSSYCTVELANDECNSIQQPKPLLCRIPFARGLVALLVTAPGTAVCRARMYASLFEPPRTCAAAIDCMSFTITSNCPTSMKPLDSHAHTDTSFIHSD